MTTRHQAEWTIRPGNPVAKLWDQEIVGTIRCFAGFVLGRYLTCQIHHFPVWDLWGKFVIGTNPEWPPPKYGQTQKLQ